MWTIKYIFFSADAYGGVQSSSVDPDRGGRRGQGSTPATGRRKSGATTGTKEGQEDGVTDRRRMDKWSF